MPTLCSFLTVSWVCLQSVIMHFLAISFFETTIIVDENTIVLHKIEIYICTSLSKLKIIGSPETKVISFRGLYNLLYYSVRKRPLHVLFFISISNIDHYILFPAKICILLLILHGLNYKPARVPPF